jgi:hypothetical protein
MIVKIKNIYNSNSNKVVAFIIFIVIFILFIIINVIIIIITTNTNTKKGWKCTKSFLSIFKVDYIVS